MITVQVTAFDAAGRNVAFALGMGTTYASAKYAATVGIKARLASAPSLAAQARRYTVEAI